MAEHGRRLALTEAASAMRHRLRDRGARYRLEATEETRRRRVLELCADTWLELWLAAPMRRGAAEFLAAQGRVQCSEQAVRHRLQVGALCPLGIPREAGGWGAGGGEGLHSNGGEPPSRRPSVRSAIVPLTASAGFNGIYDRQYPPPTALATSSNRLSNRFWGRL